MRISTRSAQTLGRTDKRVDDGDQVVSARSGCGSEAGVGTKARGGGGGGGSERAERPAG